MTDLQKGVISLIKSAIDGTAEAVPNDFDWNTAVEAGKKHQILPLLFYGAFNSGIETPPDIKRILETAVFKNISVDQNQRHQIRLIFKAFEENGIDYLPLKGTVLKEVYPKPEMRPMSDADILIKPEQYEKIRPVMAELGFEEKYESDHELVWKKKGILTVELHKRIIPSYNKDYYKYFGDGWRLAKKTQGSDYRYAMPPEDELIYNFTHMAKHYRDGGIGLRHITDIYICLAEKKLNFEYIKTELEKLQLSEFFKNVLRTVEVWFKSAETDQKTDFISEYIFSSGSYGTSERKNMAAAVKVSKTVSNSGAVKHKSLFRLIFLPYGYMCQKYRVLEKFPFLLPVMWVVRWFTAIFFKRDNIKVQNQKLKQISAENIDSFQDSLNYVGLDFNFKE